MANSEQVINLDVKTTGIKEATKQVSGLGKIVQKLSGMFKKVFSPEKVFNYFQSAVQSSGALDKELLVLQQGLGALKIAIGDAVAPFGAVFVPIMEKAVSAATGLVKAVGNVIAAFGQGAAANDTLSPQLQGVADKIWSLLEPLKDIDFAPGWIPGIGGKTIGFNLKPVNTPQIPYLAQGAVLPANKPFLAVVGDQKHGTNVEAPLATIQQAVANVMGDQTAAILAGFATSVEVQREILQAVLGIQIGDDVIGSAMSRYQQKMAVVNGGLV